jgi:hypothetical protein
LLKVLRDQLLEKAGIYPMRPQIGMFLDARAFGIIADTNGGIPFVMWGRSDLWRPDAYDRLPSNPVVWLRYDVLDRFVERVLPRIETTFVLVTTESDYSPLQYFKRAAETLLESPKVTHWFSNQCDIPPCEKVTPIPLGINYPFRNDLRFAGSLFSQPLTFQYDLAKFDRRILTLLRGRRRAADRIPVAYGDFALNNSSGRIARGMTRADVRRDLSGNPSIYFPERVLDQLDLYHHYAQCGFVVSPHGKGLDCYRTWEALLMGAIPIVKHSPLDPVFEGFPVVIVEDWSEIQAQNMSRWMDQFAGDWQHATIDMRLSHAYWVSKILQARKIQ